MAQTSGMAAPRRSSPGPNGETPSTADGVDKRLIENALLESEERYRSIVTAMSEGIVMQDATGRIVACNASAERILGLTREQMMGLTSLDPRWEAVDGNNRPMAGEDHPIRVTLRTGEPQRDVVMGVQRGDGSRAWVCINTQPLFRPGEARPYSVVASFADITEARRAEQLLRESEERFRSLYENSIDGVLLTAPDGRILAANPEACRLLGRSEQDICAVGRSGVVDHTDPRVAPYIEERRRNGKARGELTLVRGDGGCFEADVSSSIFTDHDGRVRTSLSFRDISDRKRAADALREANQQLEARVAERTRQLALLLEIGRDMASELELRPLLAHLLEELRVAIDYTGAAVALVEHDEIVFLDYTGPADRDKIVGVRVPLAYDSGYRRVIEKCAPIIVDDIWAEVGRPGAVWSIWDEGHARVMNYARSWMGVPLLAKGKIIGLLRVDHEEPGRFTESQAEQLLALGYQVGVAIVNAQLHEAAQRNAALAERERLARELHDSVSQVLYGIVLGVHSMRQRVEADEPWLGPKLDYLQALAETGLAEMRALIFELRPDLQVVGGLVGALGRHAEMVRARYNLNVETSFSGEPCLDDEAKTALYRIAQEATNNAGKHSHARNVAIRLADDTHSLTMEILDDGKGFNALQSFPGHLGLKSMAERAASIGASWSLESAPDSGTIVRVELPLGARNGT